MLSTRFKTGIVGSNEVYVFQKAGHEQLSTQTIPFPNSLITFLYMDMAIGAFIRWKNSKADAEPFKIYRREYKRRFAWIKSGRIKPEEFYAWSKISREKRADCETGTISLEEFTAWLKKS